MENGEPATGVSAPLLRLIEKAEMLFERLFATYRNRPNPSVVTSSGCDPAANGEPGTGVKRTGIEIRSENAVDIVRLRVGHEDKLPGWIHSQPLRRGSSRGEWGTRHWCQSPRLGVAAMHADPILRADSVVRTKTPEWITNHPCRAAAGIDASRNGNQGSRCRSQDGTISRSLWLTPRLRRSGFNSIRPVVSKSVIRVVRYLRMKFAFSLAVFEACIARMTVIRP